MYRIASLRARLAVGLALVLACTLALAQVGSAFTYQGQLQQAGQPADGSYDFEFRLYSTDTGGAPWAGNVQSRTLEVSEGVFSTELDFPLGPFDGSERWLEIRVRPAGQGDFVTLAPRQRLAAAPYASNAATVAPGGVDEAALSPGIVTAAKVDGASVQLRVTGQCAAGSSIRRVFEDGSVACEPDDTGGGGLWMTGTDGGLLSTLPTTVETNSSPSLPTLSLVETQDDFVRLRFRNTANTERHWTMAVGLAATQSSDRFNFFNPGVGDVLSLTGDGWVGAGTSAPVAPLAVQSDDFWRPGEGNGYGDFHVGNGIVGWSVGVALGGGGAGTTHLWTQDDKAMLFGNEANGMLLGVGIGGGDRVTLLSLAHGGAGNVALEVDPAGNVVAATTRANAPASLFGTFGGDGSDGVYDPGPGINRNRGIWQFTELHTFGLPLFYDDNPTDDIGRVYIAVQGRCTIDAPIEMKGAGRNAQQGPFVNFSFAEGVQGRDPFRRERQNDNDTCFSGSGGAGGYVSIVTGPDAGFLAGGNGGGASAPGGESETESPGARFDGIWDSYSPVGDNLLDLLRCVGGGGGAGAVYSPDALHSCNTQGLGGAGGGVVYLECGELEFTSTGVIDVSGGDGAACTAPVSGGGGGGGGGVIVIRARTIIANQGTMIVSGGQGSSGKSNAVAGGRPGSNGGDGRAMVVDLP